MSTTEERPAPYPDPRQRLRPDPTGSTVVVLADGNPWLLADGGLGNVLDGQRDRLFRGAQLDGQVAMGDVFESAGRMLQANYELSDAECVALTMGLDLDDGPRQELHERLVEGVMAAMFGPPEAERGYTEWARASLVANGISPDDVPGEIRRSVLAILVSTRRTPPVDDFVTAVAKAHAFGELRAAARPIGG